MTQRRRPCPARSAAEGGHFSRQRGRPVWGWDGPTLLDAWAGVFSERLGCWLSGVEAGRSSHPPRRRRELLVDRGDRKGQRKGSRTLSSGPKCVLAALGKSFLLTGP